LNATLAVEDRIGCLHLDPPAVVEDELFRRLADFLAADRSAGLLVTAGCWSGWGETRRLREAVAASPVPVLAAVRGRCDGEGLLLAESCHLLAAAPEASFGRAVRPLRVFPGESLERDAAAHLVSLVARRPSWLVRLAVEAVIGGDALSVEEALRREVSLFAQAVRHG
jgi:enoyl-CoA hydratase/carnithine racemase